MYYIQWIVRSNGYKGRGESILTKKIGEQWILYLNKEYPDIDHTLRSE